MTTATSNRQAIEHEIETVLGDVLPLVDLREVQVIGQGGDAMLRVVIDHPEGVDHDLCAATTRALDRAGLLERFGLEVWSPGPEPPLRTVDHYRAAVGARVALKVRGVDASRARSVTGTLLDVDEDHVELRTSEGHSAIAFDAIARGRVIERSGA